MRSVLSPLSLLSLLSVSLSAQTDPTGDWRTWKTPHFRVYARVQDSALARVAMAEAERSYALLAQELVPPRGPIELALNDNVDFSNGFTSVAPTNRISIYLATPAMDDELGQYDSWLRVVITHELTHVFHLDRSRGLWRGLQYVFGRDDRFFPNNYQPGWVVEGLAVYYESRLTNGGRERGGFHGQLLSAADNAGAWPGPNDENFNSVRWPAGIGRYAFGSRLLASETSAHGDAIIPRFVEHTSGQLFPWLVSGALKDAGGEGVPEAWDRLEKSYAAPGAPDRVIRAGMRSEPRVTISPDGRRVAFVSADGRSTPHIEVLDLDGRTVARHTVNGSVEMAWLGDTLLVTQLDAWSPVETFSDLYRWLPGGDWERITHGARLTTPFAWNGGAGAVRVAHSRRQPVLISGDSVAPLALPEADEWGALDVSPDGRWVAGIRRRAGRADLVVWPRAGPAALRAVTDDQALDGDPSWSADGAWLVFASEHSGLPQVFGYNPAAGTLVRLTDAPAGAREPALAADGRLFYAAMGTDGYALAVRDSALARTFPADSAAPPARAFDAAPAMDAVPTSYAEWWGLTPRYWRPRLDHVGGASGDFYGAETSASDAVGRLSYGADLYYAPSSQRWEGSIGVGLSRWRSVSIDASAYQVWGGTFQRSGGAGTVSDRSRVALLGVTQRWQGWRTAASVRVAGELVETSSIGDGAPLVPASGATWYGGVVSGGASRIQSNALSMSAEDGVSLNGYYRRRYRVGGPETADAAVGSLNAYLGLPLPGFAHWVLAARVAGGRTGGSNPFGLGIGGVSSDVYEIVPGVTVGDGRRTFPLRAYPAGGATFTRAASGMAELRIPLVLVGRGLWRLPVGIDRIGLSVYGEAGGAWTETTAPAPTMLRDVGSELVTDLLLGDRRYRVRGGAAVPLTDGLGVTSGTIRWYGAFGTAF